MVSRTLESPKILKPNEYVASVFFFNLNLNLNVNLQLTVFYNVDFLLRSRRYVYCYVGGGQGSGTHVPDLSYPAKSPKATQVPARITTVFKKNCVFKKDIDISATETLRTAILATSKQSKQFIVFIPVTRRIKGYTRFVGKYVTGIKKRFRPHKVCIFLIRITSRVDLYMSVCPSACPSG